MNIGIKRSVRAGLSLALVSLMLFLPLSPALAAGEDYTGAVTGWWDQLLYNAVKDTSGTEIEGYMRWLAGAGSNLPIIGHGSVCAVSEDGLHHASAYANNEVLRDTDGNPYAVARCSNCGESFNVYGTDFQKSYDTRVTELPATGCNSAGKLIWQPTISDLVTDSDYFFFRLVPNSPLHYSDFPYSSTSDSISFFSNGRGIRHVFNNTTVLDGVVYYFSAPIDGSYCLVDGLFCSWSCVDSLGASYSDTRNFSHYVRVNEYSRYSFGSVINLEPSSNCTIGDSDRVAAHGTYDFYFPTYEIIPDTAPSADTYIINSRPTSITGDYGIIGDNGKITKIQGNTIVNETNNTFYNPVTGSTTPISNWSYDYEDRSYKLTLEGGLTSTVTYGDENIVIKEGDTTYNIYYLVDNPTPEPSDTPTPSNTPVPTDTPIPSDTPVPSNTPVPTAAPAVCNHSWNETSVTPATCIVSGSRLLTCSLCGQTKTEATPALGHNWTIRQTVNTQYDESGNKTQDGYTIFECSVCGEQYKSSDGGGPPGGNTGGSGGSGGVFSGVFGLLVDFLGFFWGTFRDFVGEGVTGFLKSLMDGTSSIFGLLNPFNWGG